MSDFVPYLIQIESFEANVTSRRTYVNMVKSVTERLEYIRNNTKSVAKVIYFYYVLKIFCNCEKKKHEVYFKYSSNPNPLGLTNEIPYIDTENITTQRL